MTVASPQVTRHDSSRLTRLVYSVDLICLTNICLSKDKPEPVRVQFPPAEVFYTPKSGGRKTLNLTWTATTIGPRTTETDLNGSDPILQPSWRASTDPFAVSYGTSPHTLRVILFVASGLLLAFALFALVRFVVTGKLRFRILSPLERAVVLVERAPPECAGEAQGAGAAVARADAQRRARARARGEAARVGGADAAARR